MMYRLKYLIPAVILVLVSLSACDNEPEVEYVTEQELAEQGLIEYVDPEYPEPGDDDYVPPPFDPDTVPEQQDQEPGVSTVEELRENSMTDGKLDTDKVVGQIIHTLKYMNESSLQAGFTCTDLAYLATPILLPMSRGQTFTYMYVSRNFAKKRYHFILLNFKGIISGKNYSISCNKELMNYKEVFVFFPENEIKTQRTQTGLLLAMNDEYLKELDNMVNINWQVGGANDSYKEQGTLQVMLKKDVSGYVKK